MRILILGGNGFIGSEVARLLAERGHHVTALARDSTVAARRMEHLSWIEADIARLTTPRDWQPLVADVEIVVNCAGALQDGPRDDVAAVQETAMLALYTAARTAGLRLLVQISAHTAGGASATPFLATKHRADDALKNAGVPFVILRPAMVISRNAHGGSALLRALAAVPLVTPLAYSDAQIQFAALSDVAEAVNDAVEGGIPQGSDLPIAAPERLSLAAAVARHRTWLGLKPARAIAAPSIVTYLTTRAADLAGRLGWRSPLRSTALAAAAGGITAAEDPPWWRFKTLDETLRSAPAGVQDLWFARLYLLKPLILATLCLFWLLSGTIALLRFGASTGHLTQVGMPQAIAALLTLATSLADIALGIGVAIRRFAAMALKGMIGLSLAYLAGATILEPSLWADPLGPLVKVLPSIVLALVALAILDER